MLYDDDPRRLSHYPIWSSDRMLGRFHDDATVCTACHPGTCQDVNCYPFSANDVAEGHVGRTCGRCGKSLSEVNEEINR